MPMPPLPLRVQNLVDEQRNRLSFDFFPGRPNAALFPVKTWRRLLQANLSHGGNRGLSQYGDPAGLPALRSAIADHLATTRGIAADPGRIVIVNGAQEGISIAARLFLNHGTPSAIEDPCYQGAAFAFEATGSEITSVPVDFDGLIPEELPQRPTALLYVTPSHQYPTGHTLSLARRHAIVAWARRYGCYILEDDRDGDLRYEGSPLQAIAAHAPDCTIYLGTFSRTLGAGLRLGLHGRAGAACRRGRGRKRSAQQRQFLARTGGARRDDARRLLCGASAAQPRPLQGEPRLSAGGAAPQFRRRQRDRRNRRPAAGVVSAAWRAQRHPRRRARAPRAHRRLFVYVRRRLCGARLDVDAARLDPRLCRALAQADRAGHCAAVGRHRRRDRRSERRRQRAFRARERAPVGASRQQRCPPIALSGPQFSPSTGSNGAPPPPPRLRRPARCAKRAT